MMCRREGSRAPVLLVAAMTLPDRAAGRCGASERRGASDLESDPDLVPCIDGMLGCTERLGAPQALSGER